MGQNIATVSIKELYDTALVRIGNYLAKPELVQEEFSYETFKKLFLNQVYPLYGKYEYKRMYHTIYVTYASAYSFDPNDPPEFITRVIPVSVYGLYIGEFFNFRFLSHVSYLSTKPLSRFVLAWRYYKPKLWVGYQGEVEVEACYKLKVVDSVNDIVEVDVETRDILQDLCSAYSLVALGRSRRMVRIGDSNIEFDAEGMVAEGEELIKETRDRLINQSELVVNF